MVSARALDQMERTLKQSLRGPTVAGTMTVQSGVSGISMTAAPGSGGGTPLFYIDFKQDRPDTLASINHPYDPSGITVNHYISTWHEAIVRVAFPTAGPWLIIPVDAESAHTPYVSRVSASTRHQFQFDDGTLDPATATLYDGSEMIESEFDSMWIGNGNLSDYHMRINNTANYIRYDGSTNVKSKTLVGMRVFCRFTIYGTGTTYTMHRPLPRQRFFFVDENTIPNDRGLDPSSSSST